MKCSCGIRGCGARITVEVGWDQVAHIEVRAANLKDHISVSADSEAIEELMAELRQARRQLNKLRVA